MSAYYRLILFTLRLASILMCLVNAVYGTPLDSVRACRDTAVTKSAEIESGNICSADGTGDSPLYVPAGFISRSTQASPIDGVVTFYYPSLGSLTDVTSAVFHVADLQLTLEGDWVRIGNIGGPGGASPLYKHSHLEFYRGNPGLRSFSARAQLRIEPAQSFLKSRSYPANQIIYTR